MSRRDLLPDAGPVLSLRQALYRASRDYRGGQNALALTMGVPADELAKRLNPNDSRPLKPEWIEEILTLTLDMRILDALGNAAAAWCGMRLNRWPPTVNPSWLWGAICRRRRALCPVWLRALQIASGSATRWSDLKSMALPWCAS